MMRVKVGNKWYKPELGQPIMVEFSEADKQLVNNMAPEARRYACFDDSEQLTEGERREWVKE